jgi:hypothetical protein
MRARECSKRRCALCGSTNQVQNNHVGGQNFIAWFTSPLCREHHDKFHIAVRQAGIDLRYTTDKQERLRRARQATYVFLWMVEEYARNPSEDHDEKQAK